VAELTVRRADDGTVMFEFGEGPVEALAIAVVDDADEPVWLLFSDAFNVELPYTVESVEASSGAATESAELENELLARGVDPAALEAGRKANRPVTAFSYGTVPPGFRQTMPLGAPRALQPGRRYSVTVAGGLGAAVGQAHFTA
jgi:hypothetical protein